MEDNKLLEERLITVANCCINKNFDDLYPLLADNVIWTSNWVYEPRKGKETLIEYYKQKQEALQNSTCRTYHFLVKTTEPSPIKPNNGQNTVYLNYEPGEIMDYCFQDLGRNEDDSLLIKLKLNDERLIKRIQMIMPSLYNFEFYKDINFKNKAKH